MPKIIAIRGTSGSGKSTIAFTLLKNFPHIEYKPDGKKVWGYDVNAGLKHQIHIVGKYTTVCGGLDTVPEQRMAAEFALRAYNEGKNVIMEGLLQSAAGPKGAVTSMLHPTGDAIFAYLDTPLEVCLERVRARRLARGDERPFNTTNTVNKFDQCVSTYKGLKREGYNVILLDHKDPYTQIMNILKESE